jgi:hypothetical protein
MVDKEREHSTSSSSTSEDEITAYQQKIWDLFQNIMIWWKVHNYQIVL